MNRVESFNILARQLPLKEEIFLFLVFSSSLIFNKCKALNPLFIANVNFKKNLGSLMKSLLSS